jgi:hypothetical protein
MPFQRQIQELYGKLLQVCTLFTHAYLIHTNISPPAHARLLPISVPCAAQHPVRLLVHINIRPTADSSDSLDEAGYHRR